MNNELIFIIFPILVSSIIHHFLIINFNLFPALAKPIDFGILIKNKKIFGKSKTFRGFVVVILLTAFFSFILSKFINIDLKMNSFLAGALIGLAYSLAELPNSFLKRRFNVHESTHPKNFLRYLFSFLDHSDSILGIAIIIPFIIALEINKTILLIFIGIFLHLTIDKLLKIYSYKKTTT